MAHLFEDPLSGSGRGERRAEHLDRLRLFPELLDLVG